MLTGSRRADQRPYPGSRLPVFFTGMSAGSAHDGTIQPRSRDFVIEPDPSTAWMWSWHDEQTWRQLTGRWSLCLRDWRWWKWAAVPVHTFEIASQRPPDRARTIRFVSSGNSFGERFGRRFDEARCFGGPERFISVRRIGFLRAGIGERFIYWAVTI